MPATSVCKLCLERAELRSSHVLPEFVFKPLYDDKHGATEYTVNTARSRIIRKGYRERLFCDRCEGRFSSLESYFAQQWIDHPPFPPAIPGSSVQVRGLDYRRLKLFHLSVLWRASVTSHVAFRLIDLGAYQEELRVKLLAEDGGPEHVFAVSATLLVDPNERKVARGIFLEPEPLTVDGRLFCLFTYSGCAWYYSVGHSIPKLLADGILRSDGSMLLDVLPYTQYTTLTRVFGRLQSARRTLGK